jgi:phenylacetic acid degradation operon negative regulatory protein
VTHLHVRPANLRDGVAGVRTALRALGLPDRALVFEIDELDPADEERARALWDGDALVRGYRAARREIERSSARLPGLPESEAMVESFGLGGRVLQQLVLDPLLPAPLVDERERRALVESMRAYDRLGRDAWAGFLGRFGVPHRTAPADTRWAAEELTRSA